MKMLMLLSSSLLLTSCYNKFTGKYSVGDCFNSGKWLHEDGTTSVKMNRTFLVLAKKNKNNYTAKVFSYDINDYFNGGFRINEEDLDLNGKIDCPANIK